MERVPAQSARAAEAYEFVTALQQALVARLEAYGRELNAPQAFVAVEWFRDQGLHGGGLRYETGETAAFNRASVNLSQVQYDDQPQRQLASATALSSIVHPQNPLAPSLHLHLSWTELKAGAPYWRIMADLNPAIRQPGQREAFQACLRQAAPEHYAFAASQGNRYFYIPTLQRHRGVSHFYLEAFNTGDEAADWALAGRVGQGVIDTYAQLLAGADREPPSPAKLQQQLAYHTLYFFQVLTLDRGTTSGLLVHDQNDIGILGSLPARVDRTLLKAWEPLMPRPQDELLAALVEALPDQHPSPLDEHIKRRLARVVREHYTRYPEAMALQASGEITPPTFLNHGLVPTQKV